MELTTHNCDNEDIPIDSEVKTKRSRTVPLLNNVKAFEKGAASSSSVSDNSDSEEEWNLSKTKPSKKVPKQTLKTKLAEKTKYLRKISKLNSAVEEKCESKPFQDKKDVGNLKIKSDSELCEVKDFKQSKDDLSGDEKLIKVCSSLLANDSNTHVESAKCGIKNKKIERGITVKEESTKSNFSEDVKTTNQEPIVLICAINRPSATSNQNISTSQASSVNHVMVSPRHSSLQNDSFLVSHHVSPSMGSNSNGQVVSPEVSNNSLFNTNVQRNRNAIVEFSTYRQNSPSNATLNNDSYPMQNITPELQYSPVPNPHRRNNSLDSPSRSSPGSLTFQRTPTSVALQRTYDATSRTPSPAQRVIAQTSRIRRSVNSLQKSRRVFPPDQSPNLKNDRRSTSISNTKRTAISKTTAISLTADKNSRDSMLNKFNNISPNGTVIHTGTGSVTITPRKFTPERPPVQRKLFKNEIEGTISCRSVQGALQYVVNLANGTHIPLSNTQVQKLREQHNGVLPIKLKIPVPSDVADKIEPSFLIED